jgi:hypothetical protein
MSIGSYPKVWNLGHRAIEGILDDYVSVQEKVDGSQISFARIDDRLYVRSKGGVLVDGAREVERLQVDGMFQAGVQQIAERFGLLPEGYVFRGEYLNRPKHNTLKYDRVPEGNIAIFDVQDAEGTFLPNYIMAEFASVVGLERVPLLHREIKVGGLSVVQQMLERESFLGGTPIEGIVLKAHDRLNHFGDPMFGKYVSEAFKETHRGDWKTRNPSRADVVTSIIDQYRNAMRWEKAVQHLRDDGRLTGDVVDIGPLMKAVTEDVEEECAADIKDLLWRHFRKDILRGVQGGLPQWYKDRLAGASFDDESEAA